MARRIGSQQDEQQSRAKNSVGNGELVSSIPRPIVGGANASDEELIAEYLGGKSAAFDTLVQRHQDRLFNTLCRFLNHQEDALDVMQETYLSASQHLARFKQGSRFYTWLYRIALNHAIDLRRRNKRIRTQITGLGREAAARQTEPPRVERGLEEQESAELLQNALMALSAEHRLVLILKDIEDMQYEEIAAVLNVPIGTVRSRLHRGRLELREVLARMAPWLDDSAGSVS